jgi:hypothetical protein
MCIFFENNDIYKEHIIHQNKWAISVEKYDYTYLMLMKNIYENIWLEIVCISD